MRYGELFKIVELTQQAKAKIDFAIANTQFEWEAGNINDDNISKLPDDHPFKKNYYDKDKQKVRRVSEIGWIPDQNLRRMMLEMCFQVNSQTEWNLNITAIEPSFPETV